MRNKTSLFKRSMAALLCFVLVLSLIPAMSWVAKAAEGDEEETPVATNAPSGNYITLPITVRDFAADGMLFEYTELYRAISTERIAVNVENIGHSFYYNPTDMGIGSSLGFQVYSSLDADGRWNWYPSLPDENAALYWHCVFLDSSGNVLDVLSTGESKKTVYDDYVFNNEDFAYSVWAWAGSGKHENDEAYNLLAQITDENKSIYRIGLDLTNYKLHVGNRIIVNGTLDTTPGLYYFDYDTTLSFSSDEDARYWHCLICDSDGYVVKVLPKGSVKRGAYDAAMQSGYFSVWAWEGADDSDQYAINKEACDKISFITEENKACYQITFYGSPEGNTLGTYSLYVDEIKTYHIADAKGFGLLTTTATDYLNNLDEDTEEISLPSANIIYNTPANLPALESDIKESALWDENQMSSPYAYQDVYGALIRTNLVGKGLDADRKPVYTQDTVKYLAEYMRVMLAVPEQNADGSYNVYYTTGQKVAAGETLANRIRQQIEKNNGDENAKLGTYTASYDKFYKNNGLRTYQDIETWYDAAFFLLHNTWRDSTTYDENGNVITADNGSDGYGMPSQYTSLHLIAKTDATTGKTTYVFNSKYDDTKYDYANGEIYNTQIQTYDLAPGTDGSGYITDNNNELPKWRFDPLGIGGAGQDLGYGRGGDTYGDMSGIKATWADYYNTTNYNLTLEGHAQFVYYEDDDLYFTFTGDDDVYLYINGVRVLDIGGAHSVAQVGIKLNEVAVACGLKDGQAYPFDFFFMERHGTAANFGIETNIQLAESSMTTSKTGYQYGANTGYNGFVNPNEKVAYSFALENNGNAPIYNLTFDDPEIGIKFAYNEVKLNNDSDINAMYLYRFNANGTVKSSIPAGSLTDDKIKEELADGLPVGETIAIYGFKYKIPNTKWDKYDTFTNTVKTSAMSTQLGTAPDLFGQADWKVQKADLIYEPFHVYDWVHKDHKDVEWEARPGEPLKLTKAELIQYFADAGQTIPADKLDGLEIVICNASGNEDSLNKNNCAKVTDDGITYLSDQPGMATVFYKVIGTGLNNNVYDNFVFNFDVFTYGVMDNVYVLDYGLNVELNCDQYGFQVNDHLSVPQNQNELSKSIFIRPGEQTYGTFEFTHITETDANGKITDHGLETEYASVKYVPKKIIDGENYFAAEIKLRETPPAGVEITKEKLKFYGVDMLENISTVPANVVYYEENFPGITYVEKDGNKWTHYETVDGGQSQAGTTQSSNQDTNYGFDSNYENDKTGTLTQQGNVGTVVTNGSAGAVIDTTSFKINSDDLQEVQNKGIALLNEYLGLGGSDSNGSVNRLTVCTTDTEVMYFEFVGTGCEIISRTTADQYAVISVQVQRYNEEDGTYTVIREKPVITESKGGTLYQVPIISLKGMPKAKYRVLVYADGSTEETTRVLYIDGIRIYGPLSDEEALTYYNPEEARAEFLEVKKLIQKGQAIYADTAGTGENNKLVTGKIMVEDVDKAGVLTKITNVNQYLTVGPNNELYLSGNDTCSAFIFWLKPKEFLDENKTIPYPENARTLEIGAHRKSNALVEPIKGPAHLNYGSQPSDITGCVNQYSVNSATEMYYAIDVNKLLKDPEKGYLVMIGTNGSDSYVDTLALTNIKVAGYDISFVDEEISAYSENGGNLLDEETVRRIFELLNEQMATLKQEAEAEQIPINENLSIRIAKMMSDTVSSGKYATLTVRAGIDADKLVVKDSEGNVVQAFYNIRTVAGGEAVFTFLWQINGSSGTAQMYTVRVYDAAGNASVNAETVTVIVN